MARRYFTPATFAFLEALAANNRREWFDAHKQEYEDAVRTPALNYIEDMAADLPRVSPHFLALPRKVGGSLMRVHRDIRFGRDKRPFKTNVGIQFRHEAGKDVHAPGYYLHLEPNECFVGVGLWRPDAAALGKIRDAIAEGSEAWLQARDDKTFRRNFALEGDALANPPRGYAKEHPFLQDLKRKDHIAIARLRDSDVTGAKFYAKVSGLFADATPYMRYLCKSLDLRF